MAQWLRHSKTPHTQLVSESQPSRTEEQKHLLNKPPSLSQFMLVAGQTNTY